MTLASWFSGHSFKLEAEDFILHIHQRSFPNFGLKILLCFVFSKKSSEFLFFLILFSAGIYLLKDWLKRSQNGTNRNNKLFFTFRDENSYKWVMLNYATSHIEPQPPTTSHNELQQATRSHNEPQSPTTSHTANHNHPQRATTNHNEPKRATTNHNHLQRTTTSHNEPQPPTTSHNNPQPPTTSHNEPQQTTTTHNKPQRLTTTNPKII